MSDQHRGLKSNSAKNTWDIRDRLPSIMGWLSQYNTFRALNRACEQGNVNSERKIFIVKGKHCVPD